MTNLPHARMILALAFAIALAGCSSQPQKPKAANAADVPLDLPIGHASDAAQSETGRLAFQRDYVAARAWAADAQPISLESQPTKTANGQDGKSAVWRGTFGSASRQAMKSWTWSAVDADDAPPKGTNPGSEDSWNPGNVSAREFDFVYLKVDSDQAVKAALAHGGKESLKKSTDAKVRYTLHWNPRQSELDWQVVFESAKPLTVVINASSGGFVRVEK